ncbi:MAG: deoxyribodipyrimidine photo-lyase [Lysobacterales bacterium]
MTTTPRYREALVWFRRDLRDFDHAALYHALAEARRVHCTFIFDREILDALPHPADRRVEFIRKSVVELASSLRRLGGDLRIAHAPAREAIPRIAVELGVQAVYANHDYEPRAADRDAAVALELARHGIAFHTFKDHVVFERNEILSKAGTPFAVFTPYKNAWLRKLTPFHLRSYPVAKYMAALSPPPSAPVDIPSLAAMGFESTNLTALGVTAGMSGGARTFADFRKRIDRYRERRDYPARNGTSYLSVHLRFGTVSIREVAAFAHARMIEGGGEGASTWLSELVWRDFYAQILWHHPRVATESYKAEYSRLAYANDPAKLAAWCRGETGYPLVDAAMSQLNSTGYMHNRLRMVTASFLVKDLLVDWRWGEQYFADQLIDYDLASNNGGWQWAASTGCDAQPYFRIFNPVTQSIRFDDQGAFIRRYVPALKRLDDHEIHAPWLVPPSVLREKGIQLGRDYPLPIVNHAVAREAALALYRQ